MSNLVSLLDDRNAVVTGASRGIGWAIARTFIEQGAYVIGVDLNEPPALPSSLNGDAFTYLRGDLCTEATLDLVADAAARRRERVDILINNAAILTPTPGPVDGISDSDWDRILQINLLSVSRLSARLLPLMRSARDGRIINIGSVLSIYGAPHSAPYVVSKHALLGLTRTQALEYGRIGITANCILPGAIDTEMFQLGDADGEYRRYFESKCPLGRMATPQEIANTALFLASSLSSYINGHALIVDGGLTVGI